MPPFKYQDYLQRLKDYADLCGIRVIYHDLDGDDGAYYGRTIELRDSLEDTEEVAVFLHELGHFIHESKTRYKASKRLNRAYDKFNRGTPLTRHQKALILVCERRAWVEGASLARQLKIPRGQWFQKEMRAGLSAYRVAKVR